MKTARLRDSGEQIFANDDKCEDNRQNLKCCFCNALIVYVSRQAKIASRTKVDSFFRLKQLEVHTNDCKFDIKNMINRAVSKSAKAEKNGPILLKKNNEIFFNLNYLGESFKNKGLFSDSIYRRSVRKPTYNSRVTAFLSYINSASSITRILAGSSEKIKDFKNIIKIRYLNQLIEWKDFIYEENRYLELFEKLNSGQIKHPVAVVVTIQKERHKHKNQYLTDCACQKIDALEKIKITPVLSTFIEKIDLKVGDKFIIITEPGFKDNGEYKKIYLPIFLKSQYKKIFK